jgi:hypothetical protein
MRFKREYIILILIIVILCVYLFLRQNERVHYELPKIKPIEKNDISKLTIKKADSEIVLFRKDDRWLISPQGFPADKAIVDRMLDEVSGLTLTALASESRNYSIYELDNKKKIQVTAYKGDTPLIKFDIGKIAPSYRHTFIKLEGDYRVYHAEKNLRNTFDKTVSVLRDKVVMKINEEITELTLIKGKKQMNIRRIIAPIETEQKQQEPAQKWETDKGQKLNDEEVDEIINTLSDLSCDDFIEGKKKEDFKTPIYSVSLKGIKTYKISLFKKQDGRYPAISSESDYPFYLSEWKAKKIMKEFKELIASEK